MSEYNGYTNFETWNVALYIANDYGLYQLSLECADYAEFCEHMVEMGSLVTPDGIAWLDGDIDTAEIDDEMKAE